MSEYRHTFDNPTMSGRARYSIVQYTATDIVGSLVIRDVGPWDQHFTVTNDAEHVVRELVARGHLPIGRRLFYYDSSGHLDEILVTAGKFAGFAPGPGSVSHWKEDL